MICWTLLCHWDRKFAKDQKHNCTISKWIFWSKTKISELETFSEHFFSFFVSFFVRLCLLTFSYKPRSVGRSVCVFCAWESGSVRESFLHILCASVQLVHRYTIKIYGSLNAYDEIISWMAEPMGGEAGCCCCFFLQRNILEGRKPGRLPPQCLLFISSCPPQTPSLLCSPFLFHNITWYYDWLSMSLPLKLLSYVAQDWLSFDWLMEQLSYLAAASYGRWNYGQNRNWDILLSSSRPVLVLPVWPDWAIYWTLGIFLKPLATINLAKSPTF